MNRQLCKTKNYEVLAEYEIVTLNSDKFADLIIGDFYGDPEGAIIDWDERWIIMYGCGLILYKLQKPFEPYQYGIETNQWKEFFRNPGNGIVSIIALQQCETDMVRFCTDLADSPAIYELDLSNYKITQYNKSREIW